MRSLTSTTCIPPTAHRPQSFQSFRKQILWKKHNVWRAGYRTKTLRIMPATQTDTATPREVKEKWHWTAVPAVMRGDSVTATEISSNFKLYSLRWWAQNANEVRPGQEHDPKKIQKSTCFQWTFWRMQKSKISEERSLQGPRSFQTHEKNSRRIVERFVPKRSLFDIYFLLGLMASGKAKRRIWWQFGS